MSMTNTIKIMHFPQRHLLKKLMFCSDYISRLKITQPK